MEKVIREGKVGVLVSPEFGAGFSHRTCVNVSKLKLYHK
jgi:hypothetical protein